MFSFADAKKLIPEKQTIEWSMKLCRGVQKSTEAGWVVGNKIPLREGSSSHVLQLSRITVVYSY